MRGVLLWIVVVGGCAALSFGFWELERRFNWGLSYEANVEKSIKQHVKEECLK